VIGQALVVSERWRSPDTNASVDGPAAVALITARMSEGRYETWFESDFGRRLAITTNTDRALVMLLRDANDPGEHLIDPGGDAVQNYGYALANSQVDSYSEYHTVPLAFALDVLTGVIDGRDPIGVWLEDR
jgi:hypothetical protein